MPGPSRKTPVEGRPQITFQEMSRLIKAREKEFTLQGLFKYGYRNKEDVSNLPAETLVVGSQNVLTNAAEQVAIRNGYQLDGPAGNQNTYGIDSSYDFLTDLNGIQNLRKWGSNLEVRYVNPITQSVSWINILSTLIVTNVVNFCDFWDTNLLKNVCLFVNGLFNTVYRWTGAIGSYASSTSNTITLSGTKTLSQFKFDPAGSLLIDGITYNYTSAGLLVATTYSQNPTNNTPFVSATTWDSQMFTTGAAATQILTITPTVVPSAESAIPVIFQGSIYTDNAGVPGTLIATTQGVIGPTAVANLSPIFVFNQTISPATNYHFVISVIQVGQTIVFASQYGANIYSPVSYTLFTGTSSAVGTNISTNSGSTWSPQVGYLNMVVVENDSNLQTFNGVTPSPSGISVGDAVIQPPTVGATIITGLTLPTIDLIAQLNNQIYYGSFSSNVVYVTQKGNFADTTYSTPRRVGEGTYTALDSQLVAFKSQAGNMYVSVGKSGWWETVFENYTDATNGLTQTLEFYPLQTASNQGAQSQALIGKLKNSIVFVSNETLINAFGPVKEILGNPNFVNMSDSIKYDIDAYNFAGGQVYYYNYFVYITLPAMGIERLYNVNKKYWEAPQVVPFSRHYEVNGVLYAHSGLTNESYQCYVPGLYRDNGNPINSVVAFPYVSQQGGEANQKKNFNKQYTEGYIAGNTLLMLTINYDFGGYSGSYSTIISGSYSSKNQIIFNKITDGSLGQNSLGTEPIGSILNLPNQPAIPKFRIINTFPRVNFFEYQVVYSTDDVDQNYALLRIGPAIGGANDLPVEITQ